MDRRTKRPSHRNKMHAAVLTVQNIGSNKYGALRCFARTLPLNLLLFIFVSCQYELPDDKYFNDISKDAPKSFISLADYDNNDTIYIYQPTQFQFSITSAHQYVSKVDVLLGSTVISSFTSGNGVFNIDLFNWTPITSTLKIQFTANSGTGSLADHLGGETVTVWRSWVLIVDTNPPPTPTITVSNSNGFLQLNWPAFKKPTFIKYIVYPGHNIQSGESIEIKNQNTTSYVDSSYVGGSNTYRVSIVTTYGQSDATLTVNSPQSATYHYSAPDSLVTLVWKRQRYDGAVKNITISENGTIIDVIGSTVTDTTYSFNLKNAAFGSSSSISLTVNASHPYPGYEPFSFTVSIDNPTNAPHIIANRQPGNNQQIYFYSQSNGLVAYNQKDGYTRIYNSAMKLVDSIHTVVFSAPYPGRYFYYNPWIDNSIIQRDLTTGATKTFTPSGNGYVSNLFASSSGFVSYSLEDPVHGDFSVGLININTRTMIDIRLYRLSDDGRYANNGPLIFTYDGSQFSNMIMAPIIDGRFRPDNNDELISTASPTVIVNSSDGSILRTITPPDNSYTWKSYDPTTHMLLYTKAGSYKAYLIDIDTNSIKTINATGIAFLNGTLFDVNGNYLKIL